MSRLHCRAFRSARPILAAGLLVGAVLVLPAASVAFSAPLPQGLETPEPPPAPTATPIGSVSTTQNIFHILRFPFETMTEAVVQMSNKLVLVSFEAAGQHFGGALDTLLSGPFGLMPVGAESQLFTTVIWPHWQVTFSLALMLLPVTLLFSTVSALRYGAVSQLGWLDLKEAVGNWFISVGVAATSFYLLNLTHRLGLGAALMILQADFGEHVSGNTLAGAFFNATALVALASNAMTSPVVLYLAFLALFLASTVLMGLGLALAAYLALVYLLSVIAPLVIVLGVLPPVRWLNALWLKSISLVFLLPLADALLLKAAVSLSFNLVNASGVGDMGGFVAGLFVTAGVISVLITINFKVAEGVFGALAEVQRQANATATGVLQLVAVAGGFIAGGGSVGALGLATTHGAATPSPRASASEPALPVEPGLSAWAERSQTWVARADSATPTPGEAPKPEPVEAARVDSDYATRLSQTASPTRSRLAQFVGRALSASTRNPLLRGLGAGLQLGNAVSEAQTDRIHTPSLEPASPLEPVSASRSPVGWDAESQSTWPDDTDFLARDLQRTWATHGRNLPPADALALTQATYGVWRQQGFKGGLAAQRALAETLTDPQYTASAPAFVSAFRALAERHQFGLDKTFAEKVKTIYDRLSPRPDHPAAGRDLV